jgi:Na+/melibiose symporter-like transporter
LGGFVGSFIGAFVTEYSYSEYCFLISSFTALTLAYLSKKLNKAIEFNGVMPQQFTHSRGSLSRINLVRRAEDPGFCGDFKNNIRQICKALKISVVYRVLAFIVLNGLLIPSFGSFSYYFLTEELKVSQFSYSMLALVAYASLMVGSVLYNACMTNIDLRKILLYGVLLRLALAPLNFALILQWN